MLLFQVGISCDCIVVADFSSYSVMVIEAAIIVVVVVVVVVVVQIYHFISLGITEFRLFKFDEDNLIDKPF